MHVYYTWMRALHNKPKINLEVTFLQLVLCDNHHYMIIVTNVTGSAKMLHVLMHILTHF